MPHNHIPPEILEGARTIVSALAPAALGATVSQAFKRGLSWAERMVQIGVGIAVSWYVGGAVVAWLDAGPFTAQAISFVVAMTAYEATPRFIHRAADAVADLPAALRDRFLPRKDSK